MIYWKAVRAATCNVFNIGDGQDTIIDSAPSGDANTILLGAGVSKASVTLDQDLIAHKLVIGYGNQGDTITLKNFDPNGLFGTLVVQNLVVDGFQYSLAQQLPPSGFVDGTNAGNSFAHNTITTGPADDFIQGGIDDMTLNAGDGNDTVVGGNGNDTIHGGIGNNQLFGGTGDDLIYAEGPPSDAIDGGAGNDQLIGTGGGTYTYLFGAGGGQDVIDGSRGGTYVVQLAGNITANDISVGRSGEDITLTLPSGQASLTLQGLASNPSLQVKLPDGTVWAQATLPLPGGVVTGTTGNDSIRTGAINDLITAGAGNDFVDAGQGDDTVTGGDGNDTISGGTGALNQLIGGIGNDQIFSQGAGDTVDAGPGDDLIQASGASATIDGGTGNDTVFGAGSGTYTYLFGLGGGQDVIDASQGGSFTIQLTGNLTPSDVAVTTSGSDLHAPICRQ